MPTTTRPRVELWIRTLPTGGGEEHDELRRRLASLARRGVIEEARVRTWPHEVALDGPTTARDEVIARRVRAFRRWAAREGVELPTFGGRTTAGVGRMGPAYTALRLPRTALAVWRDGVLQWVVPCVADGRERTPAEWVDAAATGDAPGCGTDSRLVV
jgi:hypothetical protein